MKRPFLIIISVVVVFLLLGTAVTSMFSRGGASPTVVFNGNRSLGFGGGGGGSASDAVGMAPPATAAPAAIEAPAPQEAFGTSASNIAPATQERLVIQNADLAIVVKDPKARMAEISKLATDLGGYVVSSNLYETYGSSGKQVPEATIVVRMPAAKLDDALTQIKEGVVEVQSENRSGQDVTNIYVDLQSQLKAKEAADKKLLEIMDQATKSEDVLAIYMQIQSVETEIEQLKGQIKYYEESAALSAVSVRLIAEEGTQPIQVGPWKPAGAAKEAVQDLINFTQRFSEFLIRFVIFTLPALILIAIPLTLVFLAGRAVYRRFRKPSVVEEKEVKSDK